MRNLLKIYLNESGRRTDCVAEKMLMDHAVVFVCVNRQKMFCRWNFYMSSPPKTEYINGARCTRKAFLKGNLIAFLAEGKPKMAFGQHQTAQSPVSHYIVDTTNGAVPLECWAMRQNIVNHWNNIWHTLKPYRFSHRSKSIILIKNIVSMRFAHKLHCWALFGTAQNNFWYRFIAPWITGCARTYTD